MEVTLTKKMLAGLLAGSVLLTGCAVPFSEKPVASNFKTERQYKLQAVQHWQIIAQDTAAELMKTLRDEVRPLYLTTDATSAFETAFNSQLISEFVSAGFQVLESPAADALNISVKASPVRFGGSVERTAMIGEATALASGLWVLRDVYSKVSAGAAMVGLAAGYDTFNYFDSQNASGATPKTELLVTATVTANGIYYASTSSAYYTSSADWYNYSSASEQGDPERAFTLFKLTGDAQ